MLILPAVSLHAFDWGLRLNQSFEIEDAGTDAENLADNISYMGTLIPWVSLPLGAADNSKANLYIAAGLTLEYAEGNPYFIPELLRTELVYRMGEGKEFRFGRMNYADPLGFIANGLFDGARFSFDFNKSTIGAGLWYTGLLYKRNANITMTKNDQASYIEDLDFKNFADTYFAPRRLVLAMDWENPYIKPWLRLKGAFITQLDLTGRDELFHSQYFALKSSFIVKDFVFNAGGCFGLAELVANNETEMKISMAGELGVGWKMPTRLNDWINFTARVSGGTGEDNKLLAFVPITSESQGDVLSAKLSGLSLLRLEYTARVDESFSFNLATTYFVLSDLGTYSGRPDGRDGHFLGNEFSGRVIWSPFSDLQLHLGGGIFLPQLGNSGSSNGVIWRVDLAAALAFF